MTTEYLNDYYAALERLKLNKPNIIPKGTKITNDAVAMEAGRGKGSIKKSRPVYAELLAAIKEAAKIQSMPKIEQRTRLDKAKTEAFNYRQKYEEAICREISLLRELTAIKKKLSKLTGQKVLPLRGQGSER